MRAGVFFVREGGPFWGRGVSLVSPTNEAKMVRQRQVPDPARDAEEDAERSELEVSDSEESEAGEEVSLVDIYLERDGVHRDTKKALKDFIKHVTEFDKVVVSIAEEGGSKLATYLEVLQEKAADVEDIDEGEGDRRLRTIKKSVGRVANLISKQCSPTSKLPAMVGKVAIVFKMAFAKRLFGDDAAFLLLESLKTFRSGSYKALYNASAFKAHKWESRNYSKSYSKKRPSFIKKGGNGEGPSAAKKTKW